MAPRDEAGRGGPEVRFAASGAVPGGAALVALPIAAGGRLAQGARLDAALGGLLSGAARAKGLKGRRGETLEVFPPEGAPCGRVVLYGASPPRAPAPDDESGRWPRRPPPSESPLTPALAAEEAGAALFSALEAARVEEAWVAAPSAATAVPLAEGLLLRSWRFDAHVTRGPRAAPRRLRRVHVVVPGGAEGARRAAAAFAPRRAVARGVFLARRLVAEPPNLLYPESFVAEARRAMRPLGVRVSALGRAEMERLGMGALLGVAQGSERPPRLLVMEWRGGSGAPVALVGKGVCFDTGGISLKPAGGMDDMKYDMAGAGAVAGAMMALAGRRARANVVGIAGLVENMPDGRAQRPSDIVRSASGQTIEVLNTDAEGRLVLADALWYAQTKFKPRAIVDLATLTGAAVVALGHLYGACYSNSDALARALERAGGATAEGLWRMPIDPHYDRQMDSPAADMQNIGVGMGGGSITAAQFLQRFVEADTPWAHLDIAGVAWQKKPVRRQAAVGATGFGVRLLDAWVASMEGRRGG